MKVLYQNKFLANKPNCHFCRDWLSGSLSDLLELYCCRSKVNKARSVPLKADYHQNKDGLSINANWIKCMILGLERKRIDAVHKLWIKINEFPGNKEKWMLPFHNTLDLFPFTLNVVLWSNFYPLSFECMTEFHERIKTPFTVCKYLH